MTDAEKRYIEKLKQIIRDERKQRRYEQIVLWTVIILDGINLILQQFHL